MKRNSINLHDYGWQEIGSRVLFKHQVEIHMTATETDGKPKVVQVARLLNLMETETLKVYNTLISDKCTDTKVLGILNRLEKYCLLRTIEIIAHYNFFTANKMMISSICI